MKYSIFVILLTLITMSVFGQDLITITGTVADDKGNPIAGATIVEKGVFNSTLSDAEGHFQIKVKNNPVLVFEMKGYQTRSFKVNDVSIHISVVLAKKQYKNEFGLIAGGNLTFRNDFDFQNSGYHHNNNVELIDGDHSQPFWGYNAGFYMSFNNRRVFATDLMFLYDSRGVKEKYGNYTGIIQFHNVSVPVLLKFRINIHDNYLFPFFGGAGNFFINGRAEETFGSTKRSWDLENMSLISVSAIAGIGFETKSGLGARLYFNFWDGRCGGNNFAVYLMQASLSYRLFEKMVTY